MLTTSHRPATLAFLLAGSLLACAEPDAGGHRGGRGGGGHGCTGTGCGSRPSPEPTPTPPPAPSPVSPPAMDCDSARSNASHKIAVGAAGDIYVVMRCGPTRAAYIAIRAAGATAFAAPQALGFAGIREITVAAGAGILYVAATVADPSPRVVLLASSDGGSTWSALQDLGPYDDSEQVISDDISVVPVGSQVFVSFGVGPSKGTVAIVTDADGDGTWEHAEHDLAASLADLMYDPDGMGLIHASDALADANYYLEVSSDGGTTFAEAAFHGETPALLGDWAVGGGRAYFAGTGFAFLEGHDQDSTMLGIYAPASDVQAMTQTHVPGLPVVNLVDNFDQLYHRAIAADPAGNAYVVTRVPPDNAIQLDRFEGAAGVFTTPPVAIADDGQSPGVAALPGNAGAAVVYTADVAGVSSVFVAIHTY